MKRILTSPLSGAQPGVRRAYERLRRAIGGDAPAHVNSKTGEEPATPPIPEPIPLAAVPASLLELESRILLRFVLEDGPGINAIDASFEMASRFTRHGATILDLQEIDSGVLVEFLLSVEQAMFILGRTPAAPAVLERWLHGAGYLEGVRDRIDVLTATLRERYAPAAPPQESVDLPVVPAVPIRTDPRSWN